MLELLLGLLGLFVMGLTFIVTIVGFFMVLRQQHTKKEEEEKYEISSNKYRKGEVNP